MRKKYQYKHKQKGGIRGDENYRRVSHFLNEVTQRMRENNDNPPIYNSWLNMYLQILEDYPDFLIDVGDSHYLENILQLIDTILNDDNQNLPYVDTVRRHMNVRNIIENLLTSSE